MFVAGKGKLNMSPEMSATSKPVSPSRSSWPSNISGAVELARPVQSTSSRSSSSSSRSVDPRLQTGTVTYSSFHWKGDLAHPSYEVMDIYISSLPNRQKDVKDISNFLLQCEVENNGKNIRSTSSVPLHFLKGFCEGYVPDVFNVKSDGKIVAFSKFKNSMDLNVTVGVYILSIGYTLIHTFRHTLSVVRLF
ncbi:hypothetical protein BDF14DRAFT_595144 [Spinellus fusiger]|nr:hypothetical protein BDF14DRAFT_595144 [Spinellus fusiger]